MEGDPEEEEGEEAEEEGRYKRNESDEDSDYEASCSDYSQQEDSDHQTDAKSSPVRRSGNGLPSQEFESSAAAGRWVAKHRGCLLNRANAKAISSTCNGEQASAWGFRWCYCQLQPQRERTTIASGGLCSDDVIERTGKRAGKAYMNDRLAKANGLSIRHALQLAVKNKDGGDTNYKRSDIAYDLRAGFLCFKSRGYIGSM
jgi:hypothetical protein